jgi:hypothetical protein
VKPGEAGRDLLGDQPGAGGAGMIFQEDRLVAA